MGEEGRWDLKEREGGGREASGVREESARAPFEQIDWVAYKEM